VQRRDHPRLDSAIGRSSAPGLHSAGAERFKDFWWRWCEDKAVIDDASIGGRVRLGFLI
jgi:hypothetical protein